MSREKTIETSSYIMMAIFLIACFSLHLMSTLISGLSVYLLVTHFYKMIEPKMKSELASKLTLLMLIALVIIVLGGMFFGIYSAIKIGNANIKNMGQDAFNILQQLKTYLPESLVSHIPDDVIVIKEKITELAKASSAHIFEVTGHSLKVLVHVILGLLLGAIIAFSFLKKEDYIIIEGESFPIELLGAFKKHTQQSNHLPSKQELLNFLQSDTLSEEQKALLNYSNDLEEDRPLKRFLLQRIALFTDVFRKVISAQVKISGINTALTAIYLIFALKLCGVDMPYAKTLVLLTFVLGLIPVLGNLISNTLIFLISLTVGFKVAIASIIFLVVIHKMEYYINAKIVGHKIKTSIWELLLAMLIMETIFGLIGVALAPVIYGYLKEELKLKKLV